LLVSPKWAFLRISLWVWEPSERFRSSFLFHSLTARDCTTVSDSMHLEL
jgi:hypothetical protein